jgi:hypothetical protein
MKFELQHKLGGGRVKVKSKEKTRPVKGDTGLPTSAALDTESSLFGWSG